MRDADAIVVGSGPNGLAAAITIAQAGHSVVVYEAQHTIGGGSRTAELTIPGFLHDVCSSVHPMAAGSPFFRTLGLEEFGLRWIQPDIALAHPYDDDDAAALNAPLGSNLEQFGQDAGRVRALVGPLVESWGDFSGSILGPPRFPRRPFFMARFGLNAIKSASALARNFKNEKTRGVLAGLAAHSILPLDRMMTAGFGLVFWTTCYAVGWPFAAGGSQSITNALVALLKSLGGEVRAGAEVRDLRDLPAARAVLCDVTPRQFLAMAAPRIKQSERRKLEKYRYGPGSFKVDWALDGPIPWKADACRRAGTIHVGGTFEEIARSERDAWNGKHTERPFMIVAQPSVFDASRAPAGKQTAWAYCHVPHGSTFDMTERIETQMERFAPGFRQRILARSVLSPRDLQAHNANLIGGDIGGGSAEIGQLFLRPTRRMYATSIPNVFLCSSSTPPGAGVHGMCGHFAARMALKRCF